MGIYNDEVIKSFSEYEKYRNTQLKLYNLELERICKLPEEERIEQMDKMRILLRIRELYEQIDVKVVGKMIFFKGVAVLSAKQFDEIMELQNECLAEEKKLEKILLEEKFVLTDSWKEQLEQYITMRQIILESYITHSINATLPELNPQSAKLMSNKNYQKVIKLFSELNVVIKNNIVYVNDEALEKNSDGINLVERINEINKLANQIVDEMTKS